MRADEQTSGAYRNFLSRSKANPNQEATVQLWRRVRQAFNTQIPRSADPSDHPGFRPGGLGKDPGNAGLEGPFPDEKDAAARHGFRARYPVKNPGRWPTKTPAFRPVPSGGIRAALRGRGSSRMNRNECLAFNQLY